MNSKEPNEPSSVFKVTINTTCSNITFSNLFIVAKGQDDAKRLAYKCFGEKHVKDVELFFYDSIVSHECDRHPLDTQIADKLPTNY